MHRMKSMLCLAVALGLLILSAVSTSAQATTIRFTRFVFLGAAAIETVVFVSVAFVWFRSIQQ